MAVEARHAWAQSDAGIYLAGPERATFGSRMRNDGVK